jgi:hypothetical protein
VQFHLIRSGLSLLTCFICLSGFGTSYIMGAQVDVRASTIKDSQQDYAIDGLKNSITDLKASRDERRRKLDEWRKQTAAQVDDARERLSHDEGLATGAFTLLGLLNGFGLFKSYQKSREE